MGVIARQSLKGTIVTYLGVAVGFVTTFFVLTRFLSAEEIGLARVLIDAATLFIGLAQLGTSSSIIRFFPYFAEKPVRQSEGRSDNYHGFFFWTLLIPLVGFCLFACIYWACSTPLSAWFGDKSPLFVNYYYFVLPLAFFMLYQTIFETNANVLMHIVVPRAVREVVVRVGLLVCYLLYAFECISMDGFVVSLCATYAMAAAVNVVYLFSIGQISLRPDIPFLKSNPQLVRRFGLYTAFLIVSALTSVLAPMLSGFFITAKMGLNYTGIFAIATYIAVMVSIPYRSLVAITQPELAHAIKDNNKPDTTRLIAQTSNTLMLVGGFIFLLIWINIDLIFALLPNGQTFAVAKNTVLLLCLGQWMVASFNIFNSTLSYSRFYALSLLNSCVLTVSAIVLNNALIPVYGMDGAALATVLSDVIYYLLVVGISCGALRIQPFNRRHLLTVILMLALFALNYWLLPIHCLIRTVLLVGGGLAVAWFLNLSPEINALLRRIRI